MVVIATMVAATGGEGVRAQEEKPKPVPKDSVRVSVPGCTKGYIFTVGSRAASEAGSSYDIPEGMHLRMNGPKTVIAQIKAHEGSMIQVTGLMKKDQVRTDGVSLGGGIRIAPGPTNGNLSPGGGQVFIDVEAWRSLDGSCPSR